MADPIEKKRLLHVHRVIFYVHATAALVIVGAVFLVTQHVAATTGVSLTKIDFLLDTDGDGIPNDLDPDIDNDGLSNEEEKRYGTNVERKDTDNDGFSDLEEVLGGFSPIQVGFQPLGKVDTDMDGLTDEMEYEFGSHPLFSDTDADGHSDYDEVLAGYDPASLNTEKIFPPRIEVDITKQRLYYFIGDYKMRDYPVSTGNARTPTPVVETVVSHKYPTKHYYGVEPNGVEWSYPGTKWNMRIFGPYLIHGSYWHSRHGKKTMSHGCVNMRTEDAGELYSMVDIGTPVKTYGSIPPGGWVQNPY